MKERSNLSRWTTARKWLLPVLVTLTGALPFASFAATYEFNVPEGQTNIATNMIERPEYAAMLHGDTLKKTGEGTLLFDAPLPRRLQLRIDEGACFIDGTGTVYETVANATRFIKIQSGATLNINARNARMINGDDLPINFAGHGTGDGDNLGAISVGGSLSDAIFTTRPKFIMDGDATIYTYGTKNMIFSGLGGHPSTLNMNGHTLTIKGKTANSLFRTRHDWTVTNAGPIIVSNGQFSRHLATMTVLPHNIPRITFKDGALMAAFNDSATSPWTYVDAFEFEAGSKIGKGHDSPSTKATMSMKKLIGPAEISWADVTISEELVVRGSDIAAGNVLNSSCSLTFAQGSKLSLDGFGGISLAQGARHSVATSSVSIDGTPELTGVATNFFTLSKSGTELVLTVKDAVVDIVNDWGVQPGAANAAANKAAVALHVGSVGNGAVLYVPAGDYWFTDTFDLSSLTVSGVMVWNPERNAVLHSGISVGAASNVTIDGLVFDGCAGPAVVANGTVGLTVTNCGIVNVVGAYAGGHYPFAAVNVTDFNVCGCDWTADAALWDAQGSFDGGTQVAASEVYDSAVVVKVAEGESGVSWDTATNRMGLVAGAYSGKKLRKVGRGGFRPASNGVADSGVEGIEIVEGSYVATSNATLGVAGGYVRVHDGANLTFGALLSGNPASRTIYVSGTGLSPEYPAVRSETTWIEAGNTWVLEGDTLMYGVATSSSTFFNDGYINANGFTLTLKGVSGGNFRFRIRCGWSGGGKVIVDGISIYSSYGSGKGFRVDSGDVPLFAFKNGARLMPNNGDLCGLVKNCDFEYGTQISAENAAAFSFLNLTGAPEALTKVTSISVSGLFSVRAADVVAGHYATASGSLSFGPNATWKIDDPTALARGDYTVFTAAGGITGKPKADPSMGDADWRAYLSDANTLCIGPKLGLRVIFR